MPNKISQIVKQWMCFPFSHSTLLQTFRYGRPGKHLSMLLVLVFLNTLGGCYYYKVVTSEDPPPEEIRDQQNEGKFFILHYGSQAWEFSDILVDDDIILGRITPLQSHDYFKPKPKKFANRYKVSRSPEKDESKVINEVHITISEFTAAEGNEISIAVDDIKNIEIYERDTGTTNASWVSSSVGIAAIVFIVAAIVFKSLFGAFS